ncbi:MAG: TonB-dependent receptor [Acidobacteria bacterium]|nr:TonB-dependent receptor [Acidobacteriota bacterium]
MLRKAARIAGVDLRSYLAALFILLIGAFTASAQLPTATILGMVKDASGAVVPEVKLTVRHVETGQSRTAATAADGSYRFSALPVGAYELRVEHPGFRSQVRSGLTLTVGQEAVINITMELGGVEQAIEVTAEAPLVNTTSGSLGGLVDEQKVADLPLNGRNYIDLAFIQTGVSQDNLNRGPQPSGPVAVGVWFSTNGATPRSNNFMLDGAIMQNYNNATTAGSSGSTLGIEGIREFRLLTNSFGAEYGMRMGSQMIIVSKGGTNSFHGSAYEYLRNSAVDARNFFDKITAITPRRLPSFTRNQFGASIGGPIKKDKTFFYAVFESLKERLGVTNVSNTIPLSGRVDGGLVPQISPVVKLFLPLFPAPNLGLNQFTFPFSQPTDEYYGQFRIDQTVSSNDSMFVRYTVDDNMMILTSPFPQFQDLRTTRPQFVTVSEDHIFSPTLLNTARISFSRTKLVGLPFKNITDPVLSFVPGAPVGSMTIGGVSGFGAGVPSISTQNIYTIGDDLFLTRGRHALKMGALINHFRQPKVQGTNSRGNATFANIQQFLLGQPTSITAVTPGTTTDRDYRFWTVGFYAQDDWKVNTRLTLNIGLRYEFATVPTERFGRSSNLRDLLHDAEFTVGPVWKNNSLRNLSPRFGFAWDVMGDAKTAVRGGFGLLYDIANLNSIRDLGNASSPPFSSQSTLASTVANPLTLTLPFAFPPAAVGRAIRPPDYNMKQPRLLSYNLTVQRQLPFDMAFTTSYAGSRALNLPLILEGNPTVPVILPNGQPFWTVASSRINPNWGTVQYGTAASSSWYNSLQVGLDKRLSKGLQFLGSYTWSKVLDLTSLQLTPDNNSTSPVYPGNLKLDKAPAHFDLPHVLHFSTIYRLPHPVGGQFLQKVLQGWWVSSILALQSGYPVTPRLQSNRSRSLSLTGAFGGTTDRPDLNLGRNNSNITSGVSTGCLGVAPGTPVGTPNRWIDPCAFSIQLAGFLGSAGRNILRGPGLANLNFSLVKDTSLKFLGEGGKLQFRVETFNILNRANFNDPSNIIFAGTQDVQAPLANAGVITSTVTSSRQIQFALKLLF